MKIKEIAKKYQGIELHNFENFLKVSKKYKEHYSEEKKTLDDSVCSQAIADYWQMLAAMERKKQEKINSKRQAEEDKRTAMANMLITSGFNFDGYTIVKYSGYISGDDAVSVDRGTAFWNVVDVKDKLMESLVIIRRRALQELKEAAYDLGCNAIVGVDFDYLTLDPQTANMRGGTTYFPYVFGVTANGNAVVIVKNSELQKENGEKEVKFLAPMVCKSCGAVLEDGWQFCHKCGAKRT